jgi:ABC-2 type transport system ATP-binding protein
MTLLAATPRLKSALMLKRHLRGRVQQRGCAVLLATHSLDIVEHYADRAGLLLDGVIKHEWPREEIAQLRSGGLDFEAAIAQATEIPR